MDILAESKEQNVSRLLEPKGYGNVRRTLAEIFAAVSMVIPHVSAHAMEKKSDAGDIMAETILPSWDELEVQSKALRLKKEKSELSTIDGNEFSISDQIEWENLYRIISLKAKQEGDFWRAAGAADQAGDKERALELWKKVSAQAETEGNFPDAAYAADQAGDKERALELWKKVFEKPEVEKVEKVQ